VSKKDLARPFSRPYIGRIFNQLMWGGRSGFIYELLSLN